VACPKCGGTGTPPGAAVDSFAGSSPYKTLKAPRPPACQYCLGRGRVLDVVAAKDDPTCPHYLRVSECALCRPRPV
jgi:hypothetical protein